MTYLYLDQKTEETLYSVLDIALKAKGLLLVGQINQLLNAIKTDS